MRSSRGREIEIKLHVPDLRAMQRTLQRLDAKVHSRVFESNTLYDTSHSVLQTSGRVVRLRVETPVTKHAVPSRVSASKAGANRPTRGTLTYKAPIAEDGRSPGGDRYKEREEIEVKVLNIGDLARIFQGLGMRIGFRYEKFRTKYTLKKIPGLELDLDETPAGIFLELEGPRRSIDRAARLLGYAPSDYDCRSYWGLHQEYCQRRGISAPHMIFGI
jgi:adenylate cyclase class IV